MEPKRPDVGMLARATHADEDADVAQRVASGRTGTVFALMAILLAIDAADDIRLGAGSTHTILEIVVTVIGLAAAAFFFSRFARMGHRTRALLEDLDRARADADRWRQEAASVIPKLGAAIRRQLDRWGLTPEEQEVALLLLNGLVSKDIAEVLESDERTIRARAASVYAKAGLSGRAELSAFFLQDLLFLAGEGRPRRSAG